MSLVDTHLHLDAAEFAANRAQLWQQARAGGVSHAIVPAVMADTFDEVLAMREQFGVDVAFGLHPLYLAQHRDEHWHCWPTT
ncbi:TatD family hydrolase [Vogesella fluminis]|uniref:TatD family hydrolase n=1 Tax=Vogesella fluminis TaxID=1069161 RepID=UPI0036307331